MPLARKVQGSRPHSRKKAKNFIPLGSPRGTGTFRKSRNTTEKINIVANGLSNDHDQPSTDRLYLPRSSRRVRFTIRSRDVAISDSTFMAEALPAGRRCSGGAADGLGVAAGPATGACARGHRLSLPRARRTGG